MSIQPHRFRSLPVEVYAVRLNVDNQLEVALWCDGTPAEAGGVAIRTLEGTRVAKPGDWVIRYADGVHYPCPADRFTANYQLVGADRFAADAFDHLTLPHTAPDGTIVTAVEIAPDGRSALITITPAPPEAGPDPTEETS